MSTIEHPEMQTAVGVKASPLLDVKDLRVTFFHPGRRRDGGERSELRSARR